MPDIPTLFPVAHDPAPLPDDERALLDRLSVGGERELRDSEHAAARRLSTRGLIRISRQKMDSIAIRPTWFAERLP